MATELRKVGDYTLVSLLGSGGMGDVYFGVSPTADPVAVKVIRPRLVSGHTVRERFAGEVESLKTVFGSRVARLEDADPFGDPAWLAVTYVPGLTLKQLGSPRSTTSSSSRTWTTSRTSGHRTGTRRRFARRTGRRSTGRCTLCSVSGSRTRSMPGGGRRDPRWIDRCTLAGSL
jgi:hypothetical protein